MDAIVGLEVVAGEVVLGLLHPHARAHVDVGDTGLLVEFAECSRAGVLVPSHAATGDLQPVGLAGIDRILGFDEKDPSLAIEENDASRWSPQGEGHGGGT